MYILAQDGHSLDIYKSHAIFVRVVSSVFSFSENSSRDLKTSVESKYRGYSYDDSFFSREFFEYCSPFLSFYSTFFDEIFIAAGFSLASVWIIFCVLSEFYRGHFFTSSKANIDSKYVEFFYYKVFERRLFLLPIAVLGYNVYLSFEVIGIRIKKRFRLIDLCTSKF